MRILIVGGGIAGLTLAWWLRRSGHDPVVLARSPHLRAEGYLIDFFGPGDAVVERMGLRPALERIHNQIPRLSFAHPDGSEKFTLDYRTLRRTLFDDRHFNFLRGDLERLIYDEIKDHVEVRFGSTVASFEQDEAQVRATFADGGTGAFDALVGADGVHSAVRALAFGDEAKFALSLGYYTAAFILDDPPRRGMPAAACPSQVHTRTAEARPAGRLPPPSWLAHECTSICAGFWCRRSLWAFSERNHVIRRRTSAPIPRRRVDTPATQ